MAHILPFHGTLYSEDVVGDIRNVVAPPYDVIDAETQQALHARHPNNVIRLELGLDQPDDGPSQNRYSRAASLLHDWLACGALRRDPEPAIYPYTIEYRTPSSEPDEPTKVFEGFLATVELQEFDTGEIYPHENTRAAAKTDRYKLLEACRAHFSPIWSLFSDPQGTILAMLKKSVDAEKARIDFSDDEGRRHRIWSISDFSVSREILWAMGPKPLFIADGHHRYETALAYRNCVRPARERPLFVRYGVPLPYRPYNYVLMLLSSLEDPGLMVLPTHRLLRATLVAPEEMKRRLTDSFNVEEFAIRSGSESEVRARFLRQLHGRGKAGRAFGVVLKDAPSYYLVTLKPGTRPPIGDSPQEQLDVSILHSHVLPRLRATPSDGDDIDYTKDEHEALDLVACGSMKAALLLNPTKVSEVQAVAAAGDRMPHKSTYFFPKPLTGLVMNVMEFEQP